MIFIKMLSLVYDHLKLESVFQLVVVVQYFMFRFHDFILNISCM